MSISAIANVADIFAAAGVIASLLFLAVQVRQNTKAVRNQHWQAVVDRLSENTTRTLDGRVAIVVNKGMANFNDLSEPEKLIFAAWAYEFVVANNRNIAFARQGLLETEVAAMGGRNLEWFFNRPETAQWWRSDDRRPIPAHFEAIIDEALSKAGAAAA